MGPGFGGSGGSPLPAREAPHRTPASPGLTVRAAPHHSLQSHWLSLTAFPLGPRMMQLQPCCLHIVGEESSQPSLHVRSRLCCLLSDPFGCGEQCSSSAQAAALKAEQLDSAGEPESKQTQSLKEEPVSDPSLIISERTLRPWPGYYRAQTHLSPQLSLQLSQWLSGIRRGTETDCA